MVLGCFNEIGRSALGLRIVCITPQLWHVLKHKRREAAIELIAELPELS